MHPSTLPAPSTSKWSQVRSTVAVVQAARDGALGDSVMGSMTVDAEAQLGGASHANVDTSLASVLMRGARKRTRVGVPGGTPLTFDSSTIFSWSGSSFQAAFGCKCTYLHLSYFAAMICLTYYLDVSISVPSNAITLLRFAATFNLVFYSSQVLSRFDRRFHDFCKTNGAVTLVTCQAAGQLRDDKPRAALLMRYANLMMHLYYLAIDGPLDERKWQVRPPLSLPLSSLANAMVRPPSSLLLAADARSRRRDGVREGDPRQAQEEGAGGVRVGQ